LPKEKHLPLLLSSPHSGTKFPDELIHTLRPEVISHPEDTDWYVNELYDFATEMDMTLISAEFSRYVVDLNRDFRNEDLYNDGRMITSVVPTLSFARTPLYLDEGPGPLELERRLKIYYWPYYYKIQEILMEMKKEFGYALFFDCHSIKRNVPTISPDPFPDLILGDNDGLSADPRLSQIVLDTLTENDMYGVAHNRPFKGGHLTRWFGRPHEGIHALQLEMSQDLYMDEESGKFNELKAALIRERLRQALRQFEGLAQDIL
jgi:N-formylglutamate amidohydrolase